MKNYLTIYQKNAINYITKSCEALNVTPAAISDHLRKLVEEGMVKKMVKKGKRFEITLKGLIALYAAETMEKTASIIGRDFEFWNEHDLTALPPHLLLRLGELGEYEIVESGECEVLRLRHEQRSPLPRTVFEERRV